MSKTSRKKVVKKSAVKSTAVVPVTSGTDSRKKEDIPAVICNSPAALKIWENATEEERSAGLLISSLNTRSAASLINTYLDFADKWNEVFPRSNKKLYDRGMEAVKKGAQLAGFRKSTVYDILQVHRFYGRNGCEALIKKAQASGGEVTWSHLRHLTRQLKDNKETRLKVEHVITHQRITNKQFTDLVEELMPSANKTRALPVSAKEQTAIQKFIGMVSAFKGLTRRLEDFGQTILDVDAEFKGDVDQARIILEQSHMFIRCSEEVQEFLETQADYIQQMYDAASILVNGDGTRLKSKAAIAIKEQMNRERMEKRKKEEVRREILAAQGDMASDEEEENDVYYDSEEDDEDIKIDPAAGEIFDELGNLR